MKPRSGQVYQFGSYRLDCTERRLQRVREGTTLRPEEIKLRPKVFDLLCIFVERRGQVLDKEELVKLLWPDSIVEESNLTVTINGLRNALNDGKYIETVSRRGYRFTAEVQIVYDDALGSEPLANSPLVPQSPGGALLLQSPFYISRPTDDEFFNAMSRQDSIVLVKGPRQVGKTSLLARGLQKARNHNATVMLVDFQQFGASTFASADKLLLAIAESIAYELDLTPEPHLAWDNNLSPCTKFERYLRREVFPQKQTALVLGLDEVDRLFDLPCASEIFGLFRSWHNRRALDPQGPWHRLTLAMAYATEAHLFITDVNQSPFNVGTRLALEDFTLDQVSELNERYGRALQNEEEVAAFHGLLGGHPYLTQCGLYEMVKNNASLDAILEMGKKDDGVFGDHLKRMLVTLQQERALFEELRCYLVSKQKLSEDALSRLRSSGILSSDSTKEPRLRCELYAAYLERHLS
ncbi:MAG TPA: AAA-like domain-containing protein [Blastocatellia bacterium]|nr:AAA-like domain-containing protein [Blastocatellia bacterium]